MHTHSQSHVAGPKLGHSLSLAHGGHAAGSFCTLHGQQRHRPAATGLEMRAQGHGMAAPVLTQAARIALQYVQVKKQTGRRQLFQGETVSGVET